MAIEKAIAQAPSFSDLPKGFEELDPDTDENAVEVAIVNPDAVSINTEDGGVIIDFDPDAEEAGPEGHDDNLAEFMDTDALRRLSSTLVGEFEGDRSSRSDW